MSSTTTRSGRSVKPAKRMIEEVEDGMESTFEVKGPTLKIKEKTQQQRKNTTSSRSVKPIKKMVEEAQGGLESRVEAKGPRRKVKENTQRQNKTTRIGRSVKPPKRMSEDAEGDLESTVEVKRPTRKVKENTKQQKMTTTSGRSVKPAKRMSEEAEGDLESSVEVTRPARKTKEHIKQQKNALSKDEIQHLLYLSDDEDDGQDNEKNDIDDDEKLEEPQKKPIYMRRLPEEKNEFDLTHLARDPYEELDYMALDSQDAKEGKKKASKKRKPRKKKAEGILTFGSSKKDSIRKVLKQTNNIQTPSAQMTRKQAGINPHRNYDIVETTTKQPDNPVPEISVNEVFEPGPLPDFEPGPLPDFETTSKQPDNSVPVDEVLELGPLPHYDVPMQKTQNSSLLNVPKRSLKTPVVPKTAARLVQDRKASTPKAEEKKPPLTKKELMKNCFGFDDSATDEDDESVCKNDSVNFSPVQNARNSFVQMTPAKRVHLPSAATSTMSNASKSTSSAFTGNSHSFFYPQSFSRNVYLVCCCGYFERDKEDARQIFC